MSLITSKIGRIHVCLAYTFLNYLDKRQDLLFITFSHLKEIKLFLKTILGKTHKKFSQNLRKKTLKKASVKITKLSNLEKSQTLLLKKQRQLLGMSKSKMKREANFYLKSINIRLLIYCKHLMTSRQQRLTNIQRLKNKQFNLNQSLPQHQQNKELRKVKMSKLTLFRKRLHLNLMDCRNHNYFTKKIKKLRR